MLFSPLPHHCCCPAIASLKTHLCFLPFPDFFHPTPFLFGFYPFPSCPIFFLPLATLAGFCAGTKYFWSRSASPLSAIPSYPFFSVLSFLQVHAYRNWASCPSRNCAKKCFPSPFIPGKCNPTDNLPTLLKRKAFTHFFGLHTVTTTCIATICDLLLPSKCFLNVSACRRNLSDQENKRESGTVSCHSAVASLSVEH